jgi:hypothetical protein
MVYGSQHHSLTARFLVGLYLGFDKRRTNENDVGGGRPFLAVLFDCYRQSGMSERLYIGGWIYFYISIMLCPKFTTIFYTPSPLSPSNLKLNEDGGT